MDMKKATGFVGCAIIVVFMLVCGSFFERSSKSEKNIYVVFDEKKMAVGETAKVKFKNVPENAEISFKSSDRKVAKVVPKGRKINNGTIKSFGKLEAVGAGEAEIRVTITFDGQTIEDVVKVIVTEMITDEGFDE